MLEASWPARAFSNATVMPPQSARRLEYPGTISTSGSSSCDPLGTIADPRRRLASSPVTVAPVSETAPAAQRRRLRPSSSLLRFVLRRLGAFVLLMLGITLVAFLLTEIVQIGRASCRERGEDVVHSA